MREGLAEHVKSPRHVELKTQLKRILGIKKLLDDLRPTPWDCPIYYVRDDYVSRKAAGFPLPPGLEDLFPNLHELGAEELYWEYLGKKGQWDINMPLIMNDVFKMILCNMNNFSELPKFQLYSCHDSTLMLLLYSLGCFDGTWPPFAADICFELYVDEEQVGGSETFWLHVTYLGQPVALDCLWRVESAYQQPGYVPLQHLSNRWPGIIA